MNRAPPIRETRLLGRLYWPHNKAVNVQLIAYTVQSGKKVVSVTEQTTSSVLLRIL